MACVLFPSQCERRIAISEVISLMESPILRWDQNSIQKPVLEMQERQTTYRKIQEMVPLQDKIKEDERLRIKDSNKDKVNHQSMLIGNQSRSSSIGVNWHPLKPHTPIQHATTIISRQIHIHSHGCLHLFI